MNPLARLQARNAAIVSCAPNARLLTRAPLLEFLVVSPSVVRISRKALGFWLFSCANHHPPPLGIIICYGRRNALIQTPVSAAWLCCYSAFSVLQRSTGSRIARGRRSGGRSQSLLKLRHSFRDAADERNKGQGQQCGRARSCNLQLANCMYSISY